MLKSMRRKMISSETIGLEGDYEGGYVPAFLISYKEAVKSLQRTKASNPKKIYMGLSISRQPHFFSFNIDFYTMPISARRTQIRPIAPIVIDIKFPPLFVK